MKAREPHSEKEQEPDLGQTGGDLLPAGAPEVEPTMAALLIHVEYIIWAGHATRLANFDWARRRGTALHLFSVKDLHFHLYETGVEEGWITAPKKRKHPYSYYVAQAFNWNAEQVKQEARQYWRLKIKEQSQ